MRRGFINGILTGGIIGALAAMFMAPQLKPYQKKLVSQSNRVKRQARKSMKGMKSTINDIVK